MEWDGVSILHVRCWWPGGLVTDCWAPPLIARDKQQHYEYELGAVAIVLSEDTPCE